MKPHVAIPVHQLAVQAAVTAAVVQTVQLAAAAATIVISVIVVKPGSHNEIKVQINT